MFNFALDWRLKIEEFWGVLCEIFNPSLHSGRRLYLKMSRTCSKDWRCSHKTLQNSSIFDLQSRGRLNNFNETKTKLSLGPPPGSRLHPSALRIYLKDLRCIPTTSPQCNWLRQGFWEPLWRPYYWWKDENIVISGILGKLKKLWSTFWDFLQFSRIP